MGKKMAWTFQVEFPADIWGTKAIVTYHPILDKDVIPPPQFLARPGVKVTLLELFMVVT